jgi:toxin ParE1/3/4
MQPVEVRFRQEAVRDLLLIFFYVEELSRSTATARGFVRCIRERCERIGLAPSGGRLRDDLMPGLRTVAFERRAVIAYVVVEERVEIVNVFYGGGNYEALYREGSETRDDE